MIVDLSASPYPMHVVSSSSRRLDIRSSTEYPARRTTLSNSLLRRLAVMVNPLKRYHCALHFSEFRFILLQSHFTLLFALNHCIFKLTLTQFNFYFMPLQKDYFTKINHLILLTFSLYSCLVTVGEKESSMTSMRPFILSKGSEVSFPP